MKIGELSSVKHIVVTPTQRHPKQHSAVWSSTLSFFLCRAWCNCISCGKKVRKTSSMRCNSIFYGRSTRRRPSFQSCDYDTLVWSRRARTRVIHDIPIRKWTMWLNYKQPYAVRIVKSFWYSVLVRNWWCSIQNMLRSNSFTCVAGTRRHNFAWYIAHTYFLWISLSCEQIGHIGKKSLKSDCMTDRPRHLARHALFQSLPLSVTTVTLRFSADSNIASCEPREQTWVNNVEILLVRPKVAKMKVHVQFYKYVSQNSTLLWRWMELFKPWDING